MSGSLKHFLRNFSRVCCCFEDKTDTASDIAKCNLCDVMDNGMDWQHAYFLDKNWIDLEYWL